MVRMIVEDGMIDTDSRGLVVYGLVLNTRQNKEFVYSDLEVASI